MQQKNLSIVLGEPVVIAQSDLKAEMANWGNFQFPTVDLTDEGHLLCHIHVSRDSYCHLNVSSLTMLSKDGGMTWNRVDDSKFEGQLGVLLPSGDRIRIKKKNAHYAQEFDLPAVPDNQGINYNRIVDVYHASRLPKDVSSWHLERLRAASDTWEAEAHYFDIPNMSVFVLHGDWEGNLLPYIYIQGLKLDPKGRLWMYGGMYIDLGKKPPYVHSIIAVSEDEGRTFQYRGQIPYTPIKEADPAWEDRIGHLENDLTILPDGSLMMLCRLTDRFDPPTGPMHVSYSYDDGYTWTPPALFDIYSVRPKVVTLQNGVTVASYGRPGQYIRATADPAGKEWNDRITLVPPGPILQGESCSNACTIPLNDDTAYIVYSDFTYPNAQGEPVKTIIGRTITTKIL